MEDKIIARFSVMDGNKEEGSKIPPQPKMNEQLKELHETISKAWILAYDLREESTSEIYVSYSKIMAKLNFATCETYKIRDIQKEENN